MMVGDMLGNIFLIINIKLKVRTSSIAEEIIGFKDGIIINSGRLNEKKYIMERNCL